MFNTKIKILGHLGGHLQYKKVRLCTSPYLEDIARNASNSITESTATKMKTSVKKHTD